MPKSKKKGNRQPVEFVNHPDTDQPVNGLRLHKSSQTYYRIEDRKKRYYYKKNGLKGVAYLRRAVFEHECWIEGSDPTTTLEIEVNHPTYDSFGVEISPIGTVAEDGRLISIQYISPEDLAAYVREQLLNPDTRSDFAATVGIPELAYLDRLRPTESSLPLAQIGTDYLDRKQNPLNSRYLRDARIFWEEFTKVVAMEKVAELNAEHFKRYREHVYQNGKKHSPSYANNRFGLVTSVLNYALADGRDTSSIQNALMLCKMLRRIKRNGGGLNPTPISRENFHKMLSIADERYTAILLLSLNAAYYPIDVCSVTKSSVNLRRKTLVERRTKTGVPRIAVLWNRTCDAIRAYQKNHKHDSELLFLGQSGREYSPSQVARLFRKLRKEAGIPESVQFADIWDGAQTSAIEHGADLLQTEMLLGHKCKGISDNYLQRKPSMVSDACQAIEHFYFGER